MSVGHIPHPVSVFFKIQATKQLSVNHNDDGAQGHEGRTVWHHVANSTDHRSDSISEPVSGLGVREGTDEKLVRRPPGDGSPFNIGVPRIASEFA